MSDGAATMTVPELPRLEVRPPRDYITRWPQCDVHHLVLSGDDFIVFLDHDLDVDWSTTKEWGDQNAAVKELGDVLNQAAIVECIPNDHQRGNIRLNFKRMVGEGVARALDGDFEAARKILEQARNYIDTRNVEKARYWQLCTACVLGSLLGFGGFGTWLFRDPLVRDLGDTAYFLILSAFAGGIGAVVSMIFRMGRSSPTSESPKQLHILEASSRVLAGCFSALLVSGAVQAGLILSVLADPSRLHSVMLTAAVASGASERLAPSIIARIESTSDDRQKKKRRTA